MDRREGVRKVVFTHWPILTAAVVCTAKTSASYDNWMALWIVPRIVSTLCCPWISRTKKATTAYDIRITIVRGRVRSSRSQTKGKSHLTTNRDLIRFLMQLVVVSRILSTVDLKAKMWWRRGGGGVGCRKNLRPGVLTIYTNHPCSA